MARVIDKQVMLNLIIDAKRTDPETGSFAEWLAEYLVQHLPTLPAERVGECGGKAAGRRNCTWKTASNSFSML